MSYRSKTIKFISIEEFNKHLAFCKKNRVVIYEPYQKGQYCNTANIEIDIVNIRLTYKVGSKYTTYQTRLDGGDSPEKITGLLAYQTLCKYYKIPNMKEFSYFHRKEHKVNNKSQISWVLQASSPLLWSNVEKSGKLYYNCIEYDMTSAYGWALTQPIPDTTKEPSFNRIVKEGEIGFRLDGSITFNGSASIIFPLMESPFIRFVQKWFGIKKYGDKDQKTKAKQMLNFCVGYMQRTNPFIRNTIVNRCTMKMEKLIDENTLYCNTDCIVSLVPRDDIELGSDIGQFHIEHEGTFAYEGFNYQWNYELPTYRGIPKNWFTNFEKKHKRKWTILDDPIPCVSDNSEYYFDTKKLQIRRK